MRSLMDKRTGQATADVRRKLQSQLARLLRSEKGIQNSELEAWSVPRLLAHYEADAESLDTLQLLWPIQKSDYDGLFSAEEGTDRPSSRVEAETRANDG